MFSTYDGAKRLAKKLHKAVAAAGARQALCGAQAAIARAAGFRDWQHLRASGPGYRIDNRGSFERRLRGMLLKLTGLPSARVDDMLDELLQAERREIERIWRCEVLSSLPGTIEQLIDALRDPSRVDHLDIVRLAEAFGAARKCTICDDTIVRPYHFAKAAVAHYRVPRKGAAHLHEKIEQWLRAHPQSRSADGATHSCARIATQQWRKTIH
ncbi:MAG TPA: hypothetical protein VE397_18745 [Stellaceae bacterium]|jgi:hypothetical protein|nr:hypothetical protein [Stellaceae bacterium]